LPKTFLPLSILWNILDENPHTEVTFIFNRAFLQSEERFAFNINPSQLSGNYSILNRTIFVPAWRAIVFVTKLPSNSFSFVFLAVFLMPTGRASCM
jgi:hypothetical protein